MYNTASLYRLKGRWIQLQDSLLISWWNHLVEPLLALPCSYEYEEVALCVSYYTLGLNYLLMGP